MTRTAKETYNESEKMIAEFNSLRKAMVSNYCNDAEVDRALSVIEHRLKDYKRAMKQGFEIANKGASK